MHTFCACFSTRLWWKVSPFNFLRTFMLPTGVSWYKRWQTTIKHPWSILKHPWIIFVAYCIYYASSILNPPFQVSWSILVKLYLWGYCSNNTENTWKERTHHKGLFINYVLHLGGGRVFKKRWHKMTEEGGGVIQKMTDDNVSSFRRNGVQYIW